MLGTEQSGPQICLFHSLAFVHGFACSSELFRIYYYHWDWSCRGSSKEDWTSPVHALSYLVLICLNNSKIVLNWCTPFVSLVEGSFWQEENNLWWEAEGPISSWIIHRLHSFKAACPTFYQDKVATCHPDLLKPKGLGDFVLQNV